MVAFDWVGFEQALTDGLVHSVRSVIAAHLGERFYAAALDHIYRETDGVITLPCLGMNTVGALAVLPAGQQAVVRWNPPDWKHYDDEWLPEDLSQHWQRALTAEACRGTTRQWEATFRRYLTVLVRVCKRTRRALRANGVTDRDFLVLLLDDEHHNTLVKRVLTRTEVTRHFPHLDQRTIEMARVARMPQPERVGYYVARLDTFDGPIDCEDAETALRHLGTAAVPALIALLAVDGRAWRAARLLADIAHADEPVITALESALTNGNGPDQAWAARALARLARLDLVIGRADHLPQDVVVGAVAAPYTSFRNTATTPGRLDYRPLEQVLDSCPAYREALAEELEPGRRYCDITVAEVDEAVRGLASTYPLIRWHAVCVLGERRLGATVARRILPLLCRTVETDPDPTVRRLAILSLLWWANDSRRYADAIRTARDTDPATEVREAAAYWLRQQHTGTAYSCGFRRPTARSTSATPVTGRC